MEKTKMDMYESENLGTSEDGETEEAKTSDE